MSTLTLAATSDRDLTMTRDFPAPRAKVFDAWTTPEQVQRWFGPRDGSLPVCEIDLRPGGAWRYVMEVAKTGERMTLWGEYLEIVRPERVVYTEQFDPPWYPGSTMNTLTLTERGGVTTMTLVVRYPSKEVRDLTLAMGSEIDEGFQRLDELLGSAG